jgi:hypothetical protein
MSMKVHIALKGITDLDLLEEALRELGITVEQAAVGTSKQPGQVVALASVRGRRVGLARDAAGELQMVGDDQWRVMKDEGFRKKIRQHYSLAAVKRKVAEMSYRVARVENLDDGTIRLVARYWR